MLLGMSVLQGYRVPQSRADIGEKDIEAVVRTLRSGWLTSGPSVLEFERAFSDYMGGTVQAVSVASVTVGLTIAMKALGVGPGDEVITTTNTFSATAMSAYHLGARPVLVDIDPHTLTIDPAKIEAAITPRTKVLLPVHLAGLSCDMDAIGELACRHNLHVIEDAAHALPTTWKGRLVGSGAATASVFSFYTTKSITTGEGGMVTTADPDLASRMRRLRLHGIDRDAFSRLSGNSWQYDVAEAGLKANMTDIAASLGVVQLAKLDGMWARRTEIAQRYLHELAGLPLILPADARSGDRHAWHLFICRLSSEAPIGRNDFVTAMAAHGVQCAVHYIPLHRHSFWRATLGVTEAAFPQAEAVFNSTVTLPLFSAMTDDDVRYVIDVTRSILSS